MAIKREIDDTIFFEGLFEMLWLEWSLSMTKGQVVEALSSETLSQAQSLGPRGFEYPRIKRQIRDELSQWILGCPWPGDKDLRKDPNIEDFYLTGLHWMAQDKGVEVRY